MRIMREVIRALLFLIYEKTYAQYESKVPYDYLGAKFFYPHDAPRNEKDKQNVAGRRYMRGAIAHALNSY